MDFRCHIITNPVDNDEKQSLMNAIAQSENLLKNFLNNACVEKDRKKLGKMKYIVLFDQLLVVVRYMKENFETIRDIMQTVEDKVKCLKGFIRISLK